ncbi:hypothetical protein OGATHE_006799 [Ogataea polymorpha]|uniref:Uncharacterized protein n=1 Tax=Ogataea polymorpha TaxID=460523 RepID=A0A9P8SXH5_9ASCO|nr:hypothetical protein OGATHE_006799 [Ogataea polymorpha]
MIEIRRPQYSFKGESPKQPATAPRGINALTKENSGSVSDKSGTSETLAPDIKDWSTPDSIPPTDAKAANMMTICLFLVNFGV